MKYTNSNFPYDFDDTELKKQTQIYMQDGLKEVEGDHINNIIYSLRAQLGLAEIHKRQNDISNRSTFRISIAAIILSLFGVFFQWYISKQPMKMESKDLQEIKTILEKEQVSQKLDTALIYLKLSNTKYENPKTIHKKVTGK
jgi:hypothetical protein